MRGFIALAALLAGPAAASPWFTDITAETGLDFVHHNGMSGKLYFAEMMGAGGALFDYDGDGDLDLYLVQGNGFGKAAGYEHTDRLYRNELIPGGKLVFTDVTESAGLAATGYGMGIATGDIDNDGDVDFYLTNFGDNQLWRNDGDRFTDITSEWKAGDNRWSVAASFADIDHDGWLDLYVANYTDFSLETHRKCFNEAAELEYCGPNAYNPVPDRLFFNKEGSVYEGVEVFEPGTPNGAGLGVIAADFNGDRLTDFFVANDQGLNHLWINGGGGFRNEALLAGVAVNMEGKAEASMGVDAADYDQDGDIDLFMTHLARETNTLYVNDGTALFEDRTMAMGLGAASLPYTGFGTAWRDFDRDGHPDIFVANGAVMRIDDQVQQKIALPLREPNQLFANRGDGRYEEITASTPALGRPEVSRAAIFGDIDNDGDTDIVVTNNNGPAQVLRNDAASGCWLGARLWDSGHRRDAFGARAVAAGRKDWQRVRTDGSYVSAQDPRVILPLGECSPASVIVEWPDGTREEFAALETGRYHRLERGTGSKPE